MAGAVTARVLEDIPPPEEWDQRSRQSSFPIFDPAEVEIPYSDGRFIYDVIPRKVSAKSKTLFDKSCWSPLMPLTRSKSNRVFGRNPS